MPTYINLINKRFGRLIVIKRLKKTKHGAIRWQCRCDCGNLRSVIGAHLGKGTISCGCYRKELSRARRLRADSALNALLNAYVQGARKRGIQWKLSKAEFRELTSANCYYTGKAPGKIFTTPKGTGTYIYNGIDRIDNTKGYVNGNCVPCCKGINFMKNTLPIDEFLLLVKEVYEFKNLKDWKK